MLKTAWVKIHATVDAAKFRTLCTATLVFTIGVILWGALVRATGSGAGCGQHDF